MMRTGSSDSSLTTLPASNGERAPVFQGTERYELVRQLGEGAFGVVYEVFDREQEINIALKNLRRLNPQMIYDMKQEFRALAEVSHKNLVKLYEMFTGADHLFFTMELVDGLPFLDYFRDDDNEQAPFRYDKLELVLPQLINGIFALHQMGKLHRDLKPSNVLITNDGRAVILDYGLVIERDSEKSMLGTSKVEGTPAYMSPEQALGDPLSPASDWYSLGVMLFEAVAGTLPFAGETVQIMVNKVSYDPPRLSVLVPDVPPELDELVHQLLSRRPLERPNGKTLRKRYKGGRITLSFSQPGLAAKTDKSLDVRQKEFSALTSAYEVLTVGHTVITHLRGESGMGKSTLLSGFMGHVRETAPAAVLIKGRCYQQESVPYKLFDSIVDNLALFLERLPPAEALSIVPRDARALAQLFPVFQRLPHLEQLPDRKLENRNAAEIKRLAFRAFKKLCHKLGHRYPLVFLIDDIQWGDADSVAMLIELLKPPDPPPMLLVVCYQPTVLGPVVRSLPREDDGPVRVIDIELSPLSDQTSRQVARNLLSVADVTSERRAAVIAREAAGNPLMLSELVHFSLAQHDAGVLNVTQNLSLRQLIANRLSRLPARVRRMINVLSISEQPMALADVAAAAGIEKGFVPLFLTLRDKNLVYLYGLRAEDKARTINSSVRAAVLECLRPAEESELHLAIARVLIARESKDAGRICNHLLAGGAPRMALPFIERASRRASAVLAFDRAAEYLELWLANAPDDHEDRAEVYARLGETLLLAGQDYRSSRGFLAAARICDGEDSLLFALRAHTGGLLCGHLEQDWRPLLKLLAQQGVSLTPPDKVPPVAGRWQKMKSRLRVLRRVQSGPANVVGAVGIATIDSCWSLAISLLFISPAHGAEAQAAHLLAARKAAGPMRLARALATQAMYTMAFEGAGGSSRAGRLLQQAAETVETHEDRYSEGYIAFASGACDVLAGDNVSGLSKLEQAVSLFSTRCDGVAWLVGVSRLLASYCRLWIGDWRSLKESLPALVDHARKTENRFLEVAACSWVFFIYWLQLDQPHLARRQLEQSINRWPDDIYTLQHAMQLVAHCNIDLYLGKARDAFDRQTGTWSKLDHAWLNQIPFVAAQLYDLRVRCLLAFARASQGSGSQLANQTFDRLCALVQTENERLARIPLRWCKPMSELYRAGLANIRHEQTRAVQLLGQAETSLQRSQLPFQASLAAIRRRDLRDGLADDGKTVRAEFFEMLAPF